MTAGEPTIVHAARPQRWRVFLGWAAVSLNLLSACTWAFWGSIEAFHEGWWHASALPNVLWTLAYLAPAAVFVGLGLIAVRWPRLGAAVMLAFTIWFWWWWGVPARLLQGGNLVVAAGMSGIGGLLAAGWWLGRPVPRRWALLATWVVPAAVALAFGAGPAWRVTHRVDDGDRSERTIAGNGVTLTWAASGPGWPARGGASWDDAMRVAAHLSQDGARVLESPQEYWRLPTREEMVRSMVRRGRNAGGTLDASGAARYREPPDKETPLWNPRSEVIYWWTADEAGQGSAWSVTYGGMPVVRAKSGRMGTLGFRLVRR